jgi:hypothetical protein
MKHLDKFYNRKDIPWVNLIWNTYFQNGEVPQATKDRDSFWWNDVLKLCEVSRGIAMYKVENGTIILFWSNVWNDHLLQNKFPRLFSFAKNKNVSVAQFLLNNSLKEQFHLPLSIPTYTNRDTWQYI